ncbi:MAG: POTRA domain-containing protein, partial [Rikenellaceae bacterium]
MKFLKLMLATVAAMCFTQVFAQNRNDEKESTPDSVALYKGVAVMDNTETPRHYLIRKVNVHGVETIDPNVLRSSIGLIEGDSIYLPSNSINSAIQSLWNQRLYADVQVGATIDGDDVDIDIMLKERPRVFSWNFEGVSTSRQKDLRDDVLKLRRNTELSDYVIDKNIKLIKSYFAEKGFLNVEVDIRIENDRVRESMVNVTFIVDTKERVRIGEVVFEGNEAFDDKRLRRTFKKTNQKSWKFFKSFKFKEDEFENDKNLLIDFYNSQGYRNATVLSDTIYDINEKRVGVRLNISEGNKYYIRNVSWVGNSIYPTEQLSLMFGVNSGDTYDRKSMHKRLGIGSDANPDEMSISTLYQNEGYLMSMIEPAETIVGRDSIDLEMKVYEGRPFTINDITITGNITIEDEVVRREIYTHP